MPHPGAVPSGVRSTRNCLRPIGRRSAMHTRTSTFVTRAAVFLAAVALASAASAQPPPPDFSKVQVKATKISGNFYTLEGQGGVIGVLAGPEGVFMVDSQ